MTYQCVVNPGPITLAITLQEFEKDPPVLYTQLYGMWIIKGIADTIFSDSTGRTVFEWHPRRTLKPCYVARTLVRWSFTVPIPTRIYSSRLVSSVNPSTILYSPSSMSPKQATYSDEPADSYWPTTLDYGEPCAHRKAQASSVPKDVTKTEPPTHTLGKLNRNTANSAEDGDRVKNRQSLDEKSFHSSRVSRVEPAGRKTPVADPLDISTDHEMEVENQTEVQNNGRKDAVIKRKRDVDEDYHDQKRQRTAYDHDIMQECHVYNEPVTSIKPEDGRPVLKRERDTEEEEPTNKRQRVETEKEDVEMLEVDWDVEIDI